MRISVIALLLATLPSAVLHADGIRYFNNYCTVGSFRNCASVSVSVLTLPNGATVIAISIQNLQGTHPADNSPGSLIVDAVVTFPYIPIDPDTFDPEATGWSGGGGSPGYWGDGGATDYNSWNAGVRIVLFGNYSGVAGCEPPPPGTHFPNMGVATGGPQTCESIGAGPWINSYSNGLPLDWDISRAVVGWGFVNTVGPSTYCQPGVNCFQTNVTPEPVTLALVGTGLGLVGLVRRRRGKHGTLEKT